MYVFKSFDNSDIIVSPREVNKTFNISKADYAKNNITSQIINKKDNLHKSIMHLYYSNYIFSKGGQVEIDSSIDEENRKDVIFNYDNYLSTTLNPYRIPPLSSDINIGDGEVPQFDINAGVILIPKTLYGDNIKPHSFKIDGELLDVEDNGDGILVYRSGSWEYPVGNIIYEHGIIIMSPRSIYPIGYVPEDGGFGNNVYGEAIYGEDVYRSNVVLFAAEGEPNIPTLFNFDYALLSNLINGNSIITFKSSYTLYETQYKCLIENNEFNVSQNKSLKVDKNGNTQFFVQEPYFMPYITTIGLYNDSYELLAVAKLSKPLPTSKDNDMNIIIKMDKL